MKFRDELLRGSDVNLTPEELLGLVRATCRSWELTGLSSVYMRRHAVAAFAHELVDTVHDAADVFTDARALLVASKSGASRDVTAFWVLGAALVSLSMRTELVQAAALDSAYIAWAQTSGVEVPDRIGMLLAYPEDVMRDALVYLHMRVKQGSKTEVSSIAEQILYEAIAAKIHGE